MAAFRLDSIDQLARQMTFTPADTRAAQLANAEALLHSIDAAKAYPLEFVVYRITGYHPRAIHNASSPGHLLTGLALQHDLGLLIEQTSQTLEVHARSLTEPVLTIEDVTEKFNVTSKTVQRWRRRGLPARRFVFPDGKRRVGFLLSSVDRFFAVHRDQVSESSNFKQVDLAERAVILRNAARLADSCGCCEEEIARRIARKLKRSPLTVLHTVRKHDDENPANAILTRASACMNAADRAQVVAGVKEGASLFDLAKRTQLASQAVYRVILDERIATLTARKIRFIDDPLYHEPDSEASVAAIASADELPAACSGEDLRIPRDLPAYFQDLYRTPLLSAARERAIFLQFNFQKYQFVHARRKLEPQFAKVRELNEMASYLRKAMTTKNDIVRANLRLVVSVARKHLRPGLNLMELISDGNITLMRAVEGFDIHKGNRFSTYATLALMKGFARSVPLMRGRVANGGRTVNNADLLDSAQDYSTPGRINAITTRDEIRELLSRLNDRERKVLLAHYGIAGDDLISNRAAPVAGRSPEPATYEQVARQLGLSKQRVRQIEQLAIAKLRTGGL